MERRTEGICSLCKIYRAVIDKAGKQDYNKYKSKLNDKNCVDGEKYFFASVQRAAGW